MYSIILAAQWVAVTLANFRQMDCRIRVSISVRSTAKLCDDSAEMRQWVPDAG